MPGDGGLRFLINVLENNDSRWLSTNEFDDLLANLQALEALIGAAIKSPVLWKWVIIAAHTTLQSLAVCKLTRTDGFGAMHKNTEDKVEKFYADGKNSFENDEEFTALEAEDHVASFLALMRGMGYNVPNFGNIPVECDPTLLALCWLHKFRCTYIHFPPVQLTLPASEVRNIVRKAVDVVASEIEKDDWKRRPLITLDDVTPLLDSIQGRFQEVGDE